MPHRIQAAVPHRGGSVPQGQGTLGGHKWGTRTSPAASRRNHAHQVTPLSPGATSHRSPRTPEQPVSLPLGTAQSPSGWGSRPSNAAAAGSCLLFCPWPPAQLAPGPGMGRGANLIAQMVL